MKKFLLDTNICIYLLKGFYQLDEKIERAGINNCYLSEITVAELKFGAENSTNRVKNRKVIEEFINKFPILPIFNSLNIFAIEKARLRKRGTPIEDFDLLIAASSVTHNLKMITNNTNHFKRIEGIDLEDWTK